jgi:predicted nuclease of restriction endonuclease-like (RecB) superfamily
MVTIAKIERLRNIQIAKNLIELGADTAFIAKATRLPIDEVENLRIEQYIVHLI